MLEILPHTPHTYVVNRMKNNIKQADLLYS